MTTTTLGDRARARLGRLPLPLPRSYRAITSRDIWLLIAGVGALLGAMWLRHGGLAKDPLTAIGEVTALGGTYAALIGVLFAARAPWLDQVMGSDRLRVIHGVLGFIAVWAIGVHSVTSTIAFAGGSIVNAVPTLVSMVLTVPGMLGAVVGMGLFVLVAITSVRAARRRISYESWHGIHLYVYLAVAFGFLHQLTIGSDFVGDQLAADLWIGLYVLAFVPLILHRVAWPIYTTLRHRPRVHAVVREASDAFSLYVSGRDLHRLAVRSGQFFVIRALTRRDWHHGHPFSISAAPNGDYLRFTIKVYGAGTRALAALPAGTPLMLEGPYGAMHDARRGYRRLLMVAGGIGIAPIRAMAEGFAYRPGALDLIYRTRDPRDVALRRELEALAEERGIRLHIVAGRRGDPGIGRDPLGRRALLARVPDAATRDVYLCGPEGLMEHVQRELRAIGVHPDQIHLELFG